MRPSSSGAERHTDSDISPGSAFEWKREANHRLAAHRARRDALQGALPGMEDHGANRTASAAAQPRRPSVADRVAARYAQAPTYSEMLAAEAHHAARAAEAARVAAGEAHAAAQAILIGLDLDHGQPPHPETRQDSRAGEESTRRQAGNSSSAPAAHSQAGRHGPAGRPSMSQPALAEHGPVKHGAAEAGGSNHDAERDRGQEAPAPVQPLPAKLLEFPRELIAARKARPRLAEGPFREEYDRSAERSQLRIFEVDRETISTQPDALPTLPAWSSIRLGSSPDVHDDAHQQAPPEDPRSPAAQPKKARTPAPQPRNPSPTHALDLPLQTASLEDRLMAAIVDAALIVAGFLVFVLVFAACTAHPPTGRPAAVGAATALAAFTAIYLLLFVNFAHDTPGMRYAKIALCTFSDENPTRQAMRRRLGALLLSASPLGLGILWALFDHDRLGWHDRISRTYQRSYR